MSEIESILAMLDEIRFTRPMPVFTPAMIVLIPTILFRP